MRIAPPGYLLLQGLRALVASALVSGMACSGSEMPTPPPPSTVNLAGAWAGSASDSSGPGQMSWKITQTDTSFSGTMTMTDTSTGVSGQGSVSGTVSGASLHFSITVPAGGFASPYVSCTADASGDGQLSSATITGTYSGSNSCSGTIASGQLTLSKQ
jgi:hypothetical protein